MKVTIAKHAGFCMGVDLALKKLDSALLENTCLKVATLGPIIHNPQVLAEYKEKKVEVLNSVEDVEDNMCVIIRAHGIPKEDEEKLNLKDVKLIDATCPKVKAAQIAVANSTSKSSFDTLLLLYGEEEHPEVRGLVSYSSIPYLVFSNPEDVLSKLQDLPKNIILVSQTTQDKEIYNEFSKKLKDLVQGNLKILDTICNATSDRQDAVRELALDNENKPDAFIVIGGKTSGNTRRLAEIATSYKLPTYYIEQASELDIADFHNAKNIAITAGASTPNKYIEEVRKLFEG